MNKQTYAPLLISILITLLQLPGCTGNPEKPNQSASTRISEYDAAKLLMVGFRGFEVDTNRTVIKDIINYQVGGVILFDYDVPSSSRNRNIKDRNQLIDLIADLQSETEYSLLVGIDQEGGRVSRLKPSYGFPQFPSQEYVGVLNNIDSTSSIYENQAAELSELGINVNFAPVVDLNTNPDNPVIGGIERSFSDSAEEVVIHSDIAIKAYIKNSIIPVIKHFPGHGSSDKDSHLGVVDITNSWVENELIPFQVLTSKHKDVAVMTAHIFNRNYDKDWPATLSDKWINEVLRDSIEFKGVVFSDDLQMQAIRDEYGLKTTIKQALNAGVDMLVFANNSIYDEEIIPKAVSIIVSLVESGEVPASRIIESIERIETLKVSMEAGNE